MLRANVLIATMTRMKERNNNGHCNDDNDDDDGGGGDAVDDGDESTVGREGIPPCLIAFVFYLFTGLCIRCYYYCTSIRRIPGKTYVCKI